MGNLRPINHQTKTHPWGCVLASFAMAYGVSQHNLIRQIGHDGGEVWWPKLSEPMCRRGFHIQELIEVGILMGFSITMFELFPVTRSSDGQAQKAIESERRGRLFESMILNSRGVITGRGFKCHHAVAYDYGTVYDPDRDEFMYSRSECESRDFYTQCVWRVE